MFVVVLNNDSLFVGICFIGELQFVFCVLDRFFYFFCLLFELEKWFREICVYFFVIFIYDDQVELMGEEF